MNQETEGLLSPWIRNIRLKAVAKHVPEGAVVLDLACGGGYLKRFLPSGCQYFGVDWVDPPVGAAFDGFLKLDLASSDAIERICAFLPGHKASVITMVAFIEHVESPPLMLQKVLPIMSSDAMLLLTTPHPIGRKLHEVLATFGLCSRVGAEEHKAFLARRDLEGILGQSAFELKAYERFLFGLNQLVKAVPVHAQK